MSNLHFITNNLWASSIIRGEQLAEATGGKCGNNGIEYDSVAIFVKAWPINPEMLGKFREVYVDLVDDDSTLSIIKDYPHVKLIAISELAKQYISCRVLNDVTVIPEHHCNFDNLIRTRKDVKVVGYVGSKDSLDLDVILLARSLAKVGLELKILYCDGLNVTREDVVAFYRTIDIQLCYRLPRVLEHMPPEMKNPLKLYNAGSFKIPTVAYPELNYVHECKGTFYPVNNVMNLVYGCETLKGDEHLYEQYAGSSYNLAQGHHIDVIAKKYKELSNVR